MAPEEAVRAALERNGFDLADVRWIVQSHLHLDHTGAVAAIERFPNAAGARGAHASTTSRMAPEGYFAMGYIQADYDKPGIDWVFLEDVEDGYDLFGDGVLRLLADARPLAGPPLVRDAACRAARRSCWRRTRPTRSTTSTSEGRLGVHALGRRRRDRSIHRLRRLAWRADATVIAGHDPDQWPTIKRAPDFYA